jgi:dipeptidyl aminopeptidase/acylaminoacyl peptidase
MGFAVASVNYRGSAGLGARHRDAVKEGFDRVPIEDLRATVAWVSAHHAVNPKRVALFGEGFGGFIAVRATQLYPDEFRCAVMINAPSEPTAWIYEPVMVEARGRPTDGTKPKTSVADFDHDVREEFFERSRLAGLDLTDHVVKGAAPVMIIQDLSQRALWESQGTRLRDVLKKTGAEVEYLATSAAFTQGEPNTRTRVFTQIAGFLNDHIYDYRVDLGTEREVK